jgi:DNA-binding PadR family transcriptional regulator
MSTKDLILGWIIRCPIHGYGLKKHYQEFINPDERLNDAKLYPMLRQMEEEGLITRETEDREDGPSRKILKPTEEGREAFARWLESEESEDLSSRPRYDFFRAFPFLSKFSFFYELDDETALAKLERQAVMHRAKLEDFETARGKMVEKGLEHCKIRAIDFGMMLEHTILEWIDDTSKEYRRPAKTAGRAKRNKST